LPRSTVVVAASVLVLAAFGVVVACAGDDVVGPVSDVAFLGIGAYATGCAALAARRAHGRQRSAWVWMAVGLGGWAAGDTLWSFYESVLQVQPFPSLADVGYFVFPVGAAAAMVQLPSGSAGQSRLRLLLDGVVVATSLFLLLWVTALRTVYEVNRGNRLALGVSLAYPICDIMVVTIAVLVLGRSPAGQRLTMSLITAGAVLMAASDSAFAYLVARGEYHSGDLIDLGWAAALIAFGSAALLSRRPSPRDENTVAVPPRASLWLPYVPPMLGGTAASVALFPGPIRIVAPVLAVAFCVRQCIAAGENRRLLAMVSAQALRDPLTGLANRALFRDRLNHAMQLRGRDGRSVAVLSLDLNDFKLVNDSMGHPTGDALLIRVAERLLGCVRTGDTVARLGGDEFAVLLEGRLDHSQLIGERIVEAFDEPFVVDGHELLMRPSVGMAVVTPDDPDLSGEALSRQADIAMYSAKRSRTGGVHTFSSDMRLIDPDAVEQPPVTRNVAGGAETVRLLGELRHAIDHGQLDLVYQPKFDLVSLNIVGVEALLRWPHPDRGVLGPDQFLPLVRRHGLMRPVTDVVIEKALDQAAQWYSAGVGVPVAVNLFAPFLRDLELPNRLHGALNRRGLCPQALSVEITEDLVLDNVGRTRAVLQRLRERGIRIAIDDFGTGYSALWYLRELPIDEVKLDRQFVAPILTDPRAAAVVRAVVDLAHELDITTVAEGVEDGETAARLRDYGCEVGQGFYYSPPVAAAATGALLARDRGVVPLPG
jgi:diguanylate cyclase